ncbi:MAG: pro-sigmaK processing inhibitor BofA family protein [Syntrophomonadaceae bacterium]|nr:pro-sigmaK processing inhibitor BofA family protein [Syntrophomonadaceae bacterium]
MAIANVIMAALLLLVILYIIIQVFLKPVKLIWKILTNSLVGVILLLLSNYIGGYFAFVLPINIITVLIAGFLGIPGIILLACFQILI